MSNDTASTFVTYGGLLLLAGFICSSLGGGGTTMVAVMIALYFMLVATNSIERGENRTRRLLKKKGKSRD